MPACPSPARSPPLCAGRIEIDMAQLGLTSFNGLQFLSDMGLNPQEPLCILGTEGADVITGGNGDDLIYGGAGKDLISGLRGKVGSRSRGNEMK